MGASESRAEAVQLGEDLRLSQAFVGTLSAAYRGIWVFESVLERLDPGIDRGGELNKTERVLDTVDGWRKRIAAGSPLLHTAERPLLDDEGSKAWRLLQVAENRLRALIGELTSSSDLELLLREPLARHIRVAAMCEVAHARRATVRGLLEQAEALGATAEAETWRQSALMSEQNVAQAEAMFERVQQAGDEPDARLVADLLDASLLLPARVAQRVIDICRVFGLYTGVFDYEDAGIPDAQTDIWAEAGFAPHVAGRWFAAGLSPGSSLAWIRAGADDPLVAAGFLWRGFTPGKAEPWLENFIGGRHAAAWRAAGCDAVDACEWIALGVRDSMQLGPDGTSWRIM